MWTVDIVKVCVNQLDVIVKTEQFESRSAALVFVINHNKELAKVYETTNQLPETYTVALAPVEV